MNTRKNNHTPSSAEARTLWKQCAVHRPDPDDCPESDVLAAYIDHTLAKTAAQAMEKHLVYCPHCLDTLCLLRETVSIVEPVPEKYLDRVFDLVPPRRRQRFKLKDIFGSLVFPQPLRPVLAASLMFFACFGGLYFGNQTGLNQAFVRTTLANEVRFGFDDLDADLFFSEEEGS